MTWFHISIVANVLLLIIIGILTLDRVHFRKNCELRHNPIDSAIKKIETDLAEMRKEVKADLQRIWEAIDRLRER